MVKKILTFLLILSLALNAYFVWFAQPQTLGAGESAEQIREMQDRINALEEENEALKVQVLLNNQSMQSYASQVEFYRNRVVELETTFQACPVGQEGFATLQAPAVVQRIEEGENGPFVSETVIEEGALIDVSVEVRPGKGRVLVQTTPLMGVVFQDAANTAVFVAQGQTNMSLTGTDTIFSIMADEPIPAVDGPSAGALMTLLTISALENSTLDDSVTLTGTIDSEGSVGPISGVIEKAEAAKAGGKTLILLPRENDQLVSYTYVQRGAGPFTIIERKPEFIDTEEYIEENVGIDVEFVDTIEDVVEYAV
ncbi:TPA: ATP-dependent protease [Methanosarcinaceae archaeon]|nr:ATP-dependent protease [Methanosarcinaceae archaeon]